MKRHNLVGQRFGRLLVIRDAGNHIRRRKSQWEAVCDCGAKKIFIGTRLMSGQTKSCGCLAKDLLFQARSLPVGIAARNHVLYHYQADAKRRGFSWELTLEDFLRLTASECHYCGEPPSNRIGNRRTHRYNGEFVYSGLDRKDNAQGYTLQNVVPSCAICNKAKRTLSYEKFIVWLIKVGQKQIRENHDKSHFATA